MDCESVVTTDGVSHLLLGERRRGSNFYFCVCREPWSVEFGTDIASLARYPNFNAFDALAAKSLCTAFNAHVGFEAVSFATLAAVHTGPAVPLVSCMYPMLDDAWRQVDIPMHWCRCD